MSFTNKKSQKRAWGLLVFMLAISGTFFVIAPHKAAAATLEVTTKADNTTDDAACTLREAITNVNDQADTYDDCTGVGTYGTNDTIEFNISGTADFTVSSQNGYTIAPTSGLPSLSQSVTIDGYSQPGAQANAAIAPNPMNGILLIELDGTSAGNTNGITFEANNLTVKGLVINNFDVSSFDGISVAGNNNRIQGCYIGIEPDGMTAAANDLGVSNHTGTSDGLLVGGTNPEDRNILSGNYEGASSPNTGHINWTYQGNYIGVGKDGLTAVPNAQPGGSGAISIDNDDGHTVGGSVTGAINVISGNQSMGIAPHNTDNLVVEGNYFGVGYDGVTSVPNGGSGINISDSYNYKVGGSGAGEGNVIRNNANGGISITGTSNTGTIEGNSIVGNQSNGIFLFGASDTIVGGGSSAQRNHIANNDLNVTILGFGATLSGVAIQGNYIGTDENGNINPSYMASQAGIRVVGDVSGILIGGTASGQGNKIAGNGSYVLQ